MAVGKSLVLWPRYENRDRVARLEGEKRGSALVVDGGSSAADVLGIFRPGKVIHKNTTRSDIFIMWTI